MNITESVQGYSGRAQVFLNHTGVDELPEIIKHGNTPVCPSVADLHPATGCEYGCLYCCAWAQEDEPTFEPVSVEANYPDLVARYIDQSADKRTIYYLAPRTDVFAPALVDSGVTAAILSVFNEKGVRFVIVTKGGHLTEGIMSELLKAGDRGQVNITQAMPDERMRRIIEPRAPTVGERYTLARELTDRKVLVAGMIEPIIPIGSLSHIDQIMEQFREVGVSHFAVDFARVSEPALERLCHALPEEADRLRAIYTGSEAFKARFMTPGNHFVERLSPPMQYMAEQYELMKQTAGGMNATVSICNSYGLRGFNREANKSGFNCMGISTR